MQNDRENPPAFPSPDVRADDGMGIREGSSGMTLRDWVAGQALAGQLANPKAVCDKAGEPAVTKLFAKDAYALVDAMLAARTERTS